MASMEVLLRSWTYRNHSETRGQQQSGALLWCNNEEFTNLYGRDVDYGRVFG